MVGLVLSALAFVAVCAVATAVLNYGSEREREKQRELWDEVYAVRREGANAEVTRIRQICARLAETARIRIEQTKSDINRLKQLRGDLIDDLKSRDLKTTLFMDRDLTERNLYVLQGQIEQLYAFIAYLDDYNRKAQALARSGTAEDTVPDPPSLVLPEGYPYIGHIQVLTAEEVAKGEAENPWCGSLTVIEADGFAEQYPSPDGEYWCRLERGQGSQWAASVRKGELVRRKRLGQTIPGRVVEVKRDRVLLAWDQTSQPELILRNVEKQPLHLRVIPRTKLAVRIKQLKWDMRSATVTMREEEPLTRTRQNDTIYLVAGPDLPEEHRKLLREILKAPRDARISADQPESAAALMSEEPITEMADLGLQMPRSLLRFDFGQLSLTVEAVPEACLFRVLALGPGAGQDASTHTRRWGVVEEAPALDQEEKAAFVRLIYEMQDLTEKSRYAKAVSDAGRQRAFDSFDYLQAVERAKQADDRVEVTWKELTAQGSRAVLAAVTFIPELTQKQLGDLEGNKLFTAAGRELGIIRKVQMDAYALDFKAAETDEDDDEADEAESQPVELESLTLEVQATVPVPELSAEPVFISPTPLDAHTRRQQWAMNALRQGEYVNRRLPGLLLDPEAIVPACEALSAEEEAAVRTVLQGEPAAVVDHVVKILSAAECALVMGPPGTGKTTLSAALIRAFVHLHPDARVALCSQSNYAVDELFVRVADALPQGRMVRIGHPEKIADEVAPCMPGGHVVRYLERLDAAPPASERISALRENWRARVLNSPEYLEGLFLEQSLVVGATTSAMGGQATGLRNYEWDLLLIDEAGRLSFTEMLVPAVRAHRIVMVGDHRQLPPVADQRLEKVQDESVRKAIEAIRLSQFEWLWSRYPATHKIENQAQFRMAPAIGTLVANVFYPNELRNGRSTSAADFENPVILADVKGRHRRTSTGSLVNADELITAEQVIRGCRSQLEQRREAIKPKDRKVVLLTPYAAQREAARAHFERQEDLLPEGFTIECRSVEEYQGHEAALVILSLVRTAGNGAWVQNRQRLNVAISRAKHMLVILGNLAYWRETVDPEPLVARLWAESEAIDGAIRL